MTNQSEDILLSESDDEEQQEDITPTVGGFIYILSNQMYNYHGSDIYKVGKAKDVTQRLNAYTTSYLYPSETKCISPFVKDYTLAENYIFEKMKDNRIKPNRQFFEIKDMEQTTQMINSII